MDERDDPNFVMPPFLRKPPKDSLLWAQWMVSGMLGRRAKHAALGLGIRDDYYETLAYWQREVEVRRAAESTEAR
ncbi:MAG: hypothetical protein KGO01_05610 [Burkholderiales bacterium]|nr:hypothetical protein [Burkholderiales bacterium]